MENDNESYQVTFSCSPQLKAALSNFAGNWRGYIVMKDDTIIPIREVTFVSPAPTVHKNSYSLKIELKDEEH